MARTVCILCLLLAAASGPAWCDARVTATLEPPTVEVGEPAVLTITVEGASGIDGEPTLRAPDGIRVRQAGESRNFSLVNGRFTQSIQKQYVLTPVRSGDYTIPTFEAKIAGRNYTLGPFRLQAIGGGAPSTPVAPGGPSGQGQPRRGSPSGAGSVPGTGRPPADRGTPPVSLEMTAEPAEVYSGQQVILCVRFLRRPDVSVLNVRLSPPESEGFWKEDLPPERRTSRMIGAIQYEATEVRTALFPTRTGTLTIPPAVMDVSYRDPRSRGGYDPFSIFGFRGREREEEITSPSATVRVRDLPGSAPPEFTGAVGRFTIKAQLDRPEAVQGEPITWTIEISGEGNVSAVEAPRFPEVPGTRGYDAGNEVKTSRTGDSIGGSKRFSRVLVPEAAGSLRLPPIRWAYFYPASGRYESVEASAQSVTVNPARSSTGDGATGRLGGAIRGIRTRGRLHPASWDRPWAIGLFWVLQALPVAAIVAGFLVKRRREQSLLDPRGARMRRAPRRFRESLRAVGRESGDPWGALIRALEEFLADRYGPEVRGMTRPSLSGFLMERGIPEELALRIVTLLAKADSLRYVPAGSGVEEEIETAVLEAADCAGRIGGGARVA